jgi:hypothetical protein
MTRTAGSLLGVVAVAASVMLAACSSDRSRPVVAPGAAALPSSAPLPLTAALPSATEAACPLARLRGVSAAVADVPGGVAIVFDGPERAVFLLRANVRAMGTANDTNGDAFGVCACGNRNYGTLMAAGPVGTARDAHDLGLTSMQASSPSIYVPPAAATVEETSTGARLVLTAADIAEVDELRAGARQEVTAMAACLSQARF